MLRLGKATTNDVDHDHRFPGKLRRDARLVDDEEDHDASRSPIVECINTECCSGAVITRKGSVSVVRFRLGYVRYHKNGARFEAKFPVDDQEHDDAFAHGECAAESGVHVEDMERGRCYLCEQQFYCETSPEETCVLVELGLMKEGEFEAVETGAVHWACAADEWSPDLFGGICGCTE